MANPSTTSRAASSNRAARLPAAAGIAVPVVFIATVALLTWAQYQFLLDVGWRPLEEYEAEVPYPSGLARGPYGWLQTANFLVVGVLSLVFLAGLRTQFHGRWSGRLATVLLGMFGIAGLLNAVPTGLPGEAPSAAHVLHFVGFLLTMAGGLIGSFTAGLALRRNPAWRGWWVYSVLTAPTVVLFASDVMGLPGYLESDISLVLLFGWFGVMGLRLYRLSSDSAEGAAAD